MQKVKAISREIVENIGSSFERIDTSKINSALDAILASDKVLILGKGQSGLMGKVLAMKLAHLGFSSHVVGEVTTPPLKKGDLLVAISQSGETSGILNLVEKAKNVGGRIMGVTSYSDSTLSRLADVNLLIPGKIEDVQFPVLSILGDEKHKNMSGALFAVNTFVLFYGIICELAARTGQSPAEIDSRHANLE